MNDYSLASHALRKVGHDEPFPLNMEKKKERERKEWKEAPAVWWMLSRVPAAVTNPALTNILSYLLTFERVIAEPPLQPRWLRTELLLVQTKCRGNSGPHLNQGMLRVTPSAFIFMFNNLWSGGSRRVIAAPGWYFRPPSTRLRFLSPHSVSIDIQAGPAGYPQHRQFHTQWHRREEMAYLLCVAFYFHMSLAFCNVLFPLLCRFLLLSRVALWKGIAQLCRGRPAESTQVSRVRTVRSAATVAEASVWHTVCQTDSNTSLLPKPAGGAEGFGHCPHVTVTPS